MLAMACTQLLAQNQLTVTYDAQALGTMAFDAALAAIVTSAKSHAYVWIVSLAILVMSVFYAWLVLQTEGAGETGPEISDVLDRRGAWPDDVLEQQIVEDLQADVVSNRINLGIKSTRVRVALSLLLLALSLELVGKLL